jgi:hypothetical protein
MPKTLKDEHLASDVVTVSREAAEDAQERSAEKP